MQTKDDVKRMIDLGAPVDRVRCTGNMKYDQAASGDKCPAKPAFSRSELGLSEGARLMIAGSTRSGEEAWVLQAYSIVFLTLPSLVLMIAPRHLDRMDGVEQLIFEKGYLPVRKSKISGMLSLDSDKRHPVILLDTLGELGRLYPLGEFVFVGGSLVPKGGHNILEPASYRKPVFFGPHMSNFQEVADRMKISGGGIEVADGNEMGKKIAWLAGDPEAYRKRGEAAGGVVMHSRGAVRKNLEEIAGLMCG